MRTVKAYGAVNSTDPLVPLTIERRDVGLHDVLIEIDYAGICHSDIHTIRGDWGPALPTRRSSAMRSWAASPRSATRSPSIGSRPRGCRLSGQLMSLCAQCV